VDSIANSTDPIGIARASSASGSLRFNLRDALKRAFDILSAFFGLLLLSPFFAYVALRMRRDSPGPLFYRGRRIGKGEKEFKILKFRSMFERPESYTGLPITAQNDERITPFGRWLRDTKINELPQLWNVLIGEMSMVGPRPEDPDIAATWPAEVRKEVLSVRPGITSPASITYRDEESLLSGVGVMDDYLHSILPEKLRLDQLYVRNHGFLTDLDVIFMTFIMLLPRIRRVEVGETILFSGPFYNFARRYISWFLIDTLISFLAISFTGLLWRLGSPLNLGVGPALGIAVAIALLLGVTNTLFGLKRITWRYASATYVFDLALSTGLTLLILGLVDRYWFYPPLIPLRLVWDFGLLTFMGFVVVRYRERILTGLASRWVAFRGRTVAMGERVLIIGAGECGELAVWLLQKSRYANAFSITGFVDDDYHKQNYKINSYPILGTTRDIPALVAQKNIGMILFAISKCSDADRERIVAICQSTSARVVIIPDLMAALENSMQSITSKDRS
jgi:lipopolysaccharide/colanic/teichoic acid biosynthesis glycosyltransferase